MGEKRPLTISEETWTELRERKAPDETVDDVLQELLAETTGSQPTSDE